MVNVAQRKETEKVTTWASGDFGSDLDFSAGAAVNTRFAAKPPQLGRILHIIAGSSTPLVPEDRSPTFLYGRDFSI